MRPVIDRTPAGAGNESSPENPPTWDADCREQVAAESSTALWMVAALFETGHSPE
jgi:hypothetical protein